MADFRTHVTTSSVLGAGYAGMGAVMGMPLDTCVVAGGLCGVSGMLPDLDSDSGIPLREAMGFAAAVIPMLLVDRFEMLGLRHDVMIILTAGIYFGIRFAGASLVSRFSVHRGMFHSLPAAFIFAGVVFIIVDYADLNVRYFKAGGVLAGVLSHLMLDELYSIEWRGGRWRFKRSFGTALKLWGKNGWANFSTYAKLAVVMAIIFGEPSVMNHLAERYPQLAEQIERYDDYKQGVVDRLGGSNTSPSEEPTPPPAPLPEPTTNPPARESTPWAPLPQTPPSQPFPAAAPSTPGGGFAPNSGGARWDQAMRPVPDGQ